MNTMNTSVILPTSATSSDNAIIKLFRYYFPESLPSEVTVATSKYLPGLLEKKARLFPEKGVALFEKILYSEAIENHHALSLMAGLTDYLANIIDSHAYTETGLSNDLPSALPDDLISIPVTAFDPASVRLCSSILKQLDIHADLWENSDCVARFLNSCCHLMIEKHDMEILIFALIRLSEEKENGQESGENAENSDVAVSGLMVMASRIASAKRSESMQPIIKFDPFLKSMLFSLLFRYAGHGDPAARIAILRYLPSLGTHIPQKSWELFQIVRKKPFDDLWSYATPFLINQCNDRFDDVKEILWEMKQERAYDALFAWGNLSAFALISGMITEKRLAEDLDKLKNRDAFAGVLDSFRLYLPSFLPSNRQLQAIGNKPQNFFPSARTFVRIFYHSPYQFDITWFYKWLEQVCRKKPFMAYQICEDIMSMIEVSASIFFILEDVKNVIAILSEAAARNSPSLASAVSKMESKIESKINGS
ncbi:hypothetical protein QUF76_04495 [Desulfobacterales bacterium HSG16]|nr:hypothetical protein [Desulfobacterales bacterium HSG16]